LAGPACQQLGAHEFSPKSRRIRVEAAQNLINFALPIALSGFERGRQVVQDNEQFLVLGRDRP
jgi:hypothetical protein